MAIAAAISRDSGGDSTGTQDITVSGFGTPQAAIVWGTGAESDGALRNGLDFSIGFTDGTRQRCCCIFSENGVPTADTDKRQFTDEIVAQLDPGGSAVDAEANFSSFSSDKMTINWGVGTLGTAMLFQTLLLKGFDNVYAGTITLGNKDVAVPITDPGFTPDLVLFISVCRSEIDQTVASAALNIGVAHNGGSIVQRSYNFLTSNDAAKTIAMARLQTDCVSLQYADYEGGIYYYVELTSFDANGFTVYPRTNDAASDVIFYLALKYSSGEFYLGTMDSPTSTGNDAQTGPGFEPTMVMLLPTLLQAVNTPVYPNQNEDDVAWGLAAFTETEEFCHSVHEENDSPTIDNAVLSDDTAINLYEDEHSSQMFVAAFSSMDSNGWTLNFSTVDSTTRKWIAIAIGEGAGQPPIQIGNASIALVGEPLIVNAETVISITKGAISYIGKALKISETIHITKAAISYVGKSLKINEALQIGKATISYVGKALKVSETIQIAKATMSYVGKALKINEALQLGKAAITYVGEPLTIPGATIIQIGKASISLVGKAVIVNIKVVLTITKAAIAYTGKALKINEAIQIGKAAITCVGKAVVVNLKQTIAIANAAISYVGKALKINEIIHIGKAAISYVGKSFTIAGEVAEVLRRKTWLLYHKALDWGKYPKKRGR